MKKNFKFTDLLVIIIMIICIIGIIWTTTHIISWNKDKNKTDKIISDLQNTTKVEEIQNDNIEVNIN